MIAGLAAAAFKLKGDKPRQQSSRVELADDRLNTAEAARDGMHRHNIAIADRGKRRKTEIDQIAEELWSLRDAHSGQRVWNNQIHHPIEPDEYLANGQIKQHRASDAMIGDAAG